MDGGGVEVENLLNGKKKKKGRGQCAKRRANKIEKNKPGRNEETEKKNSEKAKERERQEEGRER